jgi:hypothetical protein
MGIDEAAKIANTLGGVSFATLLVIVLIGNKIRIWRWGQDFVEQEARHVAALADCTERAAAEHAILSEQIVFWRQVALRNTGILETQTEQLMTVATQVGAVNRKLLAGGNSGRP